MSFDLFYVPCRFGTEAVEKANPFTGEVKVVLPNLPLSIHDRDAVRDVIDRAGGVVSDGFESYLVQFRDGGVAEIFSRSKLETGCMVAIRRGLTTELLRFLFDLLGAADWILLPAMEGNPAMTALPGRAAAFDRFPEVVCHSAEELGAVLIWGFEGWRQYRDRVVDLNSRPATPLASRGGVSTTDGTDHTDGNLGPNREHQPE
ncbi:hypothetical protein [Aquisphaera insulae]|uniref:hypothetical protein n=1 Tax=Aquisphaera insulae TaxID=2712864 RepID=UPI0013EC109F|nr:hypothetical protein [Aquisphaera insulae]